MTSKNTNIDDKFVDFIEKLESKFEFYFQLKEGNMYTICWESGGLYGGTCWDEDEDDVHTEIKADSKYENLIDNINEYILKKLLNDNYSKMEDLRKNLWSEEYYDSEYEYYGNYTEYTYIYLKGDYLESLIAKKLS